MDELFSGKRNNLIDHTINLCIISKIAATIEYTKWLVRIMERKVAFVYQVLFGSAQKTDLQRKRYFLEWITEDYICQVGRPLKPLRFNSGTNPTVVAKLAVLVGW